MGMITAAADGVIIDVRVTPRASRSGLDGEHAGALRVRLHAPPVEGAANDELVRMLADALDVPKRAVAIVSGQGSRTKRVKVTGIDVEAARQRIDAAGQPRRS